MSPETTVTPTDQGYPAFLVRRLQLACSCGECDSCAAATLLLSLLDGYDTLLEALKALTARAEREMVDPIDVGEIQYAKDVIAKAEGR